MRNFSILTLCLVLFTSSQTTWGQEPLITNIKNRQTTSLNGYWKYIVDPYENGYYNYRYEPFDKEVQPSRNAFFTNSKPRDKSDLIEYDFEASDSIYVPGDWNTQKEKLYYYEGTVWYMTTFDYKKNEEKNRVFVHFGAVNYKAEVYLNGKKLGSHVGGFTPFNFEVSDLLKDEENFLIVKVDNKRLKDGVPTLNTDWWNYGGITRDVNLIETAEVFIEDYTVQLGAKDPNSIAVNVQLNGIERSGKELQITIPDLKISQTLLTNKDGFAEDKIRSNNIDYWSPDNPKLYPVTIALNQNKILDSIGLRSISTKGKDILLNGKSVFLRGISIHEESPITLGRGNSEEDAHTLLTWAKDLGCNFVRLAHYPHSENMVRLADRMGMMVWEENPVYWTIQWENEETYHNAENQLSELIKRDKNRASVIIWSMANETPNSDARLMFLTNLTETARKLDNTRLISAALEQSNVNNNPNIKTIADPFAEHVDVLSFNQYIGWYEGNVDKIDKITWDIKIDKPVLISEFGAGAKYGLHGAKDERWTEEYQEELYRETLEMISKIDQLRGLTPWILVDFRSPRRPLPKIQDDYNRKGLISEKGEKKKAFFVLQDHYKKIQDKK